MGDSHGRKRPYFRAVFWGGVSVALYAALLSNQEEINGIVGKGGVYYALFPILTAFVFSFVHGSFTGHFWSSLGVEASKKIRGGK